MPMFKFIQKPFQTFSTFLPCKLCGIGRQNHYGICHDCWSQLPWQSHVITKQEMSFYIACQYGYPINRIIQQFKYEQQLHFQNLLAGLILQLNLPKVQAIVPMPISEERLIERGFNQTLVIAKLIAKQLNIPVWQPIQRTHQHSQKGLNRLCM